MINIANVYEEVEFNGKKYSILKFNCEHCEQSFNSFQFTLSVFLYGVAFLTGKEFSYVGITCPSCLNTFLLKGDDLTKLRQDMGGFMDLNSNFMELEFKYHSSIIYDPTQIEHLNSYEILNRNFLLSEENFHDELIIYLNRKKYIEEDFMSSYMPDTAISMGPVLSVWWFNPNHIESLVEIENQHKIRIFPRYLHKASWQVVYDTFCWNYRLFKEYRTRESEDVGDSGYIICEDAREEAYRQHESYRESRKMLEKDQNPESMAYHFMELPADYYFKMFPAKEDGINNDEALIDLLLEFNPLWQDFPRWQWGFLNGMWKSITPFKNDLVPDSVEDLESIKYSPKMSDAEVNEIIDEIKPYRRKGYIKEWSVDNLQGFIGDYISLARRPDFSYGYVWDLKCHYLQQLHDFIAKVAAQENKIIKDAKIETKKVTGAKYAFVSEGDTWKIKYDGKIISGLRTKGIRYIHYLVANQGKEIDTFSLGSLDGDSKGIIAEPTFKDKGKEEKEEKIIKKWEETADVDDIADDELKKFYKKRIIELKLQIKDAKEMGNDQFRKEAESDLEKTKESYNKDFYRGKTRKFDDGTMKDRNAIARSISRAIDEIEGKKPADQNSFRKKVASHFREALKPISLYKISYTPKEKIDWIL